MSVRVTGTLTITFDTSEEMVRAGTDVQSNPSLTIVSQDVANLTATVQLDMTTTV